MPLTIWSALKLIETMACTRAIKPPAIIAPITPPITLCVAKALITPAYAPVSIMPSMAIFTTPLRSEMTPPNAGSRSRAANCRVDCQRSPDGRTRSNTCKNTANPPQYVEYYPHPWLRMGRLHYRANQPQYPQSLQAREEVGAETLILREVSAE